MPSRELGARIAFAAGGALSLVAALIGLAEGIGWLVILGVVLATVLLGLLAATRGQH